MYWLPEVQSPILLCNKFKYILEETKEFILEKGWIHTLQAAHTCISASACTNTNECPCWNTKISTNSSRNHVLY